MVPRRAPANAKSSASGTTPARAPISRWIVSIRDAPSARAAASATSSMLTTRLNSCMGEHDLLCAEAVVRPHLGADDGGHDAVLLVELREHHRRQGGHALADRLGQRHADL